jgi:hypothetical protein
MPKSINTFNPWDIDNIGGDVLALCVLAIFWNSFFGF